MMAECSPSLLHRQAVSSLQIEAGAVSTLENHTNVSANWPPYFWSGFCESGSGQLFSSLTCAASGAFQSSFVSDLFDKTVCCCPQPFSSCLTQGEVLTICDLLSITHCR